MTSNPIQLGQFFTQFTDLRDTIQDWAVKDNFEYRIQCKDSTRVDYRCKTNPGRHGVGCQWRVYAAKTKYGDIKVRKLFSEHSCLGTAPTTRSVHNSQTWLRRHIPQHLVITKQTSARDIQQTIQLHHNAIVSYQAAHEVYSVLANDNIGYERDSYQRLPAYIEQIRQHNPDCYTHLETQPDTDNKIILQRFHRLFISPAPARYSFQHCRKFIAVDGTFCKARFPQILLLAVTIDANGHIVLLAWAIVEGENKDSWCYFMHHLKNAIPEVTEGCTVISDREKGLLIAIDLLGPLVTRAHCTFHLQENFKKFGKGITDKYFWKIANAKTEAEYEIQMQLLRTEKNAAAEYLMGVDKELWVTAFFPGTRYGHTTSNIVESLNKTLKPARELPVLDLLNEIWHSQMTLRFRRFQQANDPKYQDFTPFCKTIAQTSSVWSQSNNIRLASYTRAEVQQRNDQEQGRNRIFLVNCTLNTFSHILSIYTNIFVSGN